jgi:hypothetical protein
LKHVRFNSSTINLATLQNTHRDGPPSPSTGVDDHEPELVTIPSSASEEYRTGIHGADPMLVLPVEQIEHGTCTVSHTSTLVFD